MGGGDPHPALDAPHQGGRLVAAEVVAGLPDQDGADVLEDIRRVLRRRRGRRAQSLQQLARQFRRGQDPIHHPGLDGVPGHAVVQGGGRSLGQGPPIPLQDRPQPGRAVPARAGQHDPDGPLAQALRRGLEQDVARQRLRLGGRVTDDPKPVPLPGQGHARFQHQRAVRFHRVAGPGPQDRDGRLALHQVGQEVGLVTGMVLEHQIGHPGPPGHPFKERAQRLQPPRGGQDAGDGATEARSLGIGLGAAHDLLHGGA